jgi:murein DD-endopeptidase MepM/ murein hydrolase activator NlpD
MDNEKVTILIVSSDNQEVKSYSVNKSLISNYKKYLFYSGLFFAAIFLLISLLSLFALKSALDNSSLTSKINSLNHQITVYDSLQLIHKLNKIDNNLTMINSYLQNRGIYETQNSGGEPNYNKIIHFIDKIDYFEKQSIIFYSTLRNLPIGFPYDGEVSSEYGYRRNPFGGFSSEFHSGIDFKGEIGTPVFATGDGIVNRCDWYGGYGNAVVIDHRSGYQSLYGHLSRVNVYQGQSVKAGDIIGFLGSTGRSTGPHVHYEIRKNGEDIDPEPFLSAF